MFSEIRAIYYVFVSDSYERKHNAADFAHYVFHLYVYKCTSNNTFISNILICTWIINAQFYSFFIFCYFFKKKQHLKHKKRRCFFFSTRARMERVKKHDNYNHPWDECRGDRLVCIFIFSVNRFTPTGNDFFFTRKGIIFSLDEVSRKIHIAHNIMTSMRCSVNQLR